MTASTGLGRPPGRPGAPGGRRDPLSALRHSQFRWLFSSNMAFFMAMNAQMLVRGWLAWELTDSELALGSVSFAVAVPMMVIAPFGGVISDRVERRNLIVLGQATLIIGEFGVLMLLITGLLQFWHLLVLATLMGCAFPFIMPARQAIVVNVVGKEGLPNAMALGMAGMNMTRVLGPALAGYLLWALPIEAAYAVSVGLYAVALGCMLGVHRSPPHPDARDRSIMKSLGEGGSYIVNHRLVLILLFFGLVPMFLAMPFQTLLVVFADDIWQVGARGLGFLSAAAGVGGVVGSMYVAWNSDSSHRLRQMVWSAVFFGAFLLFFSVSPWFLAALPLILLANIFSSIYGTLNNTAIQLLIPDEVRGRISSFLMMSFSLPLLGTLPMSAVAEVYGAPVAVGAAAILAVVTVILFYALSPALRNLDAAVLKAVRE
ncbi:MAG: MFS transporter [Deltaproteobacteria bacterium]|nr:MFS transporter [Deltaproteobacteria bacterium]MBW2413291.1 MFS transporter [Deltaproteobacteria bacterium]